MTTSTNRPPRKRRLAIAAPLARITSLPDRNWDGVINEANIHAVAARLNGLLAGKRFAIASLHRADSLVSSIELQTDCELRNNSGDGNRGLVCITQGGVTPYLDFSAGGWCWTMHAAPGASNDHDGHHYAHVEFKRTSVTFVQRAPAGKGYLHRHVFKLQDAED